MSYTPLQSRLMAQSGGASGVTLSTSESDLARLSLPGGTIGTNGRATWFYAGNITTSGVTLPTLIVRAKYGSGTLVVVNALTLLTSLTQGKFFITASLFGAGSTSSQYLFVEMHEQITALAGTNNLYNPHASGTSLSITSTSAQDFALTVQLSAALGTVTLTRELSRLELQTPG